MIAIYTDFVIDPAPLKVFHSAPSLRYSNVIKKNKETKSLLYFNLFVAYRTSYWIWSVALIPCNSDDVKINHYGSDAYSRFGQEAVVSTKIILRL